MPDFLDGGIYHEEDGELSGEIHPHRDEEIGKQRDSQRFINTEKLFIGDEIQAILEKKERIDLLLDYRIDEISDEIIREEFHSIFDRLVDIESNIDSNDLLEIKKWIINSKEDKLVQLLLMHSDYSFGFYKLSITDIIELLCYIIDSINGIHADGEFDYTEE